MSATKPPAGYDDKFVVPLEPSRRGAHRARVSPVVSALPVLAVAAVVVVTIVLAWTLLGHQGGGSGATAAGPGVTGQGQTSAGTKPSASTPAASPSATPGGTTTPTGGASTPPDGVDRTVPVKVDNSSGIGGLAKKVAQRLKNKGWTISGTPGNVTPTRPTTVYYATAAQKAAAEALAKDLGGNYRVRLSAALANGGLAVIVGKDYVSP